MKINKQIKKTNKGTKQNKKKKEKITVRFLFLTAKKIEKNKAKKKKPSETNSLRVRLVASS